MATNIFFSIYLSNSAWLNRLLCIHPLRRQREPTQHVRRLTEISFVWHEHIAGAPTHRSAESRAQHAHTRAIYIIHTQQRTHASRWHTHTEKQAHTHHAHWPVRRTQSKYVRTESKLASTHASNPAAACAGRRWDSKRDCTLKLSMQGWRCWAGDGGVGTALDSFPVAWSLGRQRGDS